MFSTNQFYGFSFPTQIRFGVGVRREIPAALHAGGVTRPLVVTDAGLRDNPMISAMREMLSQNKLPQALFADFSGNPVESHVQAGVKGFHDHNADGIVAVGGGAALDVAKAIALMSRHDGAILDYCEGHPKQRAITNPLPFVIAVPTTSGTGSEVGRSTVISDEKTHEKKIIFHPSLLARLVIADPELTLGMPTPITAATGMDALSHLLESYLAKDFHPICDAIALHGLGILKDNLARCCDTPSDMAARANMMLAAMMGAIAFQKGLGVTHSCAHALSSVCNTHHGLANGVMLPYAMAFNAKRVPEKFHAIARALKLPKESGDNVVEWTSNLQKIISIPERLSQIGVKTEHVESLADFAIKDSCHLSNPVSVSRADFVELFKNAL